MIKNDGSNLVLIIGAMKSGTTGLFKILSQHPNIIPTIKTEGHFFTKNYDKGLQYYKQLWPENSVKKPLYLESTPGYTKNHLFPEVASNIYKSYPKVRLIYIIREPVSRTETNHRQYINDSGDRRGINEYLPEELVKTSLYYEQIKDYLKFFDKKQILIIRTRDFKSFPIKTLSSINEFLDIEGYDFKDLNVKYGDSSVTNRRFYQKYRKNQILKFLANILPQKLKYSLIKMVSKKEFITNDLWKLDEDNRRALNERFKNDKEMMFKEFNVDIS